MSRPAQLVQLPAIADARGHLGVISAAKDLGFAIRRLFYIYHTPATAHRGGHAHKALQQFLIIIGSAPITLRLDNGHTQTPFEIQPYVQGLYIPPMHWVDIDHIPAGSCILVACSDEYDEGDYLRDYSDFLNHARHQGNNAKSLPRSTAINPVYQQQPIEKTQKKLQSGLLIGRQCHSNPKL